MEGETEREREREREKERIDIHEEEYKDEERYSVKAMDKIRDTQDYRERGKTAKI